MLGHVAQTFGKAVYEGEVWHDIHPVLFIVGIAIGGCRR